MDCFSALRTFSTFGHEACNKVTFDRNTPAAGRPYRNRRSLRDGWTNYDCIAPVIAALPLWLAVQGVRRTIEYAVLCRKLLRGVP